MSTGDGQTNGTGGFGIESCLASSDGVGGHGSVAAGGTTNEPRPSRRRLASAKVRDNLEIEAEARIGKANAATSRQARPPPPPKDNRRILAAVDQNIPIDNTPDRTTTTSDISDLVRSLSIDDDGDVGSDAEDSNLPFDEINVGSGIEVKLHRPQWKSRVVNTHANRHNYDGERNCDFNSYESINHYFPPYAGKGTMDIPLFMLREAHDNKAKAKMMRHWRSLTTAQQRTLAAEKRAQRENAQQRGCNSRRKRSITDANASDDDGDDQTQAEQPNKKQKKPTDRQIFGSFEDNEDAWQRLMRNEENKIARQIEKAKVNSQRQQQQEETTTAINGLLVGGQEAAEASAAAAALKPSKYRRVSDPPATLTQLNDKIVRRLIIGAEQAVMKVATATIPEDGVDFGSAIVRTVGFTVSNVSRTNKDGGVAALQQLENPEIRIMNPGGDDRVLDYIRQAIDRVRGIGNDSTLTSPVLVDGHITYCTNHKQVENDHTMQDRRKAKTGSDIHTNNQFIMHAEESLYD